ncbi:LPXTG cell wall anchor domain-containing protein, partial [Aeribacillus composti]|uniref:LPXTG cell wall anchor domain-containing protein n=1 Tax=Aeribacillus composti TaxID=1868734 RepID=UPI002E201914|nr:LPXTG cell wall anchor domain-containing protein [Aeribacillus composti]
QPAEPEQPGENPEQPAEPEQPGENPEQPAEPEQPGEKTGQPAEPEQLAEEKKELEGKKLPNTATNQFNFLLIGTILLGMGSICFAVVRKKYN